MKVGDYVRLDRCQGIRKIDDYDEETKEYFLDSDIWDEWGDLTLKLEKYDVIKFSPNIIDLIEIGDYANGHKVTAFMYDGKNNRIGVVVDSEQWAYDIDEIKSIVTKEQFRIMKYKVGDEE